MHIKSRLAVAVLAAALCLATPGVTTGASAAAPSDPGVINHWNMIATRTVFENNPTPVPVPASPLYLAFTHLAMYDAVVWIEGGYEPYVDQGPAGRSGVWAGASSEVAAATAAYDVLRHYFPVASASLRSQYLAYLEGMPAGRATSLGKTVGKQAAKNIIRLRADDGRNASVTFTPTPAPGVWRPTPPANAPMAVPWLASVEPLLLESPNQFPLPGPDPIDSAAYAVDFAEVKAWGAAVGSTRTPAETANAIFFNDNPVGQYQLGMRDQVTDRGLDIVEAARAFAILDASMADALIASWRSKVDYAYWRPITAIHLADTDDNPATVADPTWTSFRPTPPYPDYVSGHAPVTGATTGTLAYLFGANAINFTVPRFPPTAGPARDFATTAALDQAAMDARIQLGFHFRKAMTDGNALGHDVVDYATANYFQPLN
jgi:hypothetical protein